MTFERWWLAAAWVAAGIFLGSGAARCTELGTEAPARQGPIAIELVACEVATAKPLPAELRIVGVDRAAASPRRVALPPSGRATLALERGAWRVTASTAGHRPVSARLVAAPDAPATWVFELETTVAAEPRPGATRLDEPVGDSVLTGLVVAAESGEPLAGAQVRTDDGGTTWTDGSGRYELRQPAEDLPGPDLAGWPTVSIEVSYDGRATRRIEDVLPVAGRLFHLWRLSPGKGTEVVRDEHRFRSSIGGAALEAPDPEAAANTGPSAPSGLVLAPPASVRVGFADAGCATPCCTNDCTAVCVLPLESYVARGLNDEWISSWDADSLAAGAIAYRSYASYRVDHPIRPEFDLCSSACCQVNDPDTATRTDTAVAATAGILLERNGTAFQAEYSAENNAWDDPSDGLVCSNSDLSCGDGSVGSPVFGWPCLADVVAAGHGCFGHGRGMSQWGSKRWSDPAPAPARTWRWILDHYYNASGSPAGMRSAFLASPVDVDGGAVCPRVAGPGARLALHAGATDLAAIEHPSVLFGASVVTPTGVFVSDPDDDVAAPLAPGANLETREFDLPGDAAAGLWDVWLALWLDVDGDGAVTSTDLRLDHVVLADALEVDPALELVFADCFEGGDAARWSAALP
jgi:hypothetical protein